MGCTMTIISVLCIFLPSAPYFCALFRQPKPQTTNKQWICGRRKIQHVVEIFMEGLLNPNSFTLFWDEWSLISSILILHTSSSKVSRYSHANGSIEIEGAASPSGTEEVLMCEMYQAVLCVKVIRRWGICLHGRYVRCSRISVVWQSICTFLHVCIFLLGVMFSIKLLGCLFRQVFATLYSVSGRLRVK